MDIWSYYDMWLILLTLAFPRIMLLVGNNSTVMILSPVWWWISWLIFPRFLVAATWTYRFWDQNWMFLIGIWVVSAILEFLEKKLIT